MKPENVLSLAERLNATNGRPSGFDYLRLGLAISVVIVHSVKTTYGNDAELWVTPLRPFVRAIIPMFFALSGFLVAGSLGAFQDHADLYRLALDPHLSGARR